MSTTPTSSLPAALTRPLDVFIDFETRSSNTHFTDTGALEPWAAGFEVASLAAAWRNSRGKLLSVFSTDLDEIRWMLELFAVQAHWRVWAYNVAYEMQVMAAVYPDISLTFAGDVQRLVLVYDNGGNFPPKKTVTEDADDDAEEPPEFHQGLGLKKAGRRILGLAVDTDTDCARLLRYDPAEVEAHAWIRENLGVRAGREGSQLASLPPDILSRYNRADVENTLRLFDQTTAAFAALEYNWQIDMALFMSSVGFIVQAKARGVLVDRAKLAEYHTKVLGEVRDVENAFVAEFAEEIKSVQLGLHEEETAKRKTQRGRDRVPIPEFNIGSNKQLALLFVENVGLKPAFTTDTGQPSFAKAHLGTWGRGGEILLTRRARQIVASQCDSLLFKSAVDGLWHVDLKANGTRSGRFAGAGGLNVQGLARRDLGLMAALVARPGHLIASIDLSAGEPTVTAHFSKDENYYQTCFGMVGKKPYFAEGRLVCDDLYLSVMSVSPVGRADLLAAWHADYAGKSFADQWVIDSDVVKARLKKQRQFHKMLALAISYGLGPKGMVAQSREHGKPMDLKTCRAFYNAYWSLFPDVRAFGDQCAAYVDRKGFIVNPFGFRLVCPSYIAMNQFIQSTVSGIMHVYLKLLMDLCGDYAFFLTCIHDELLIEFPAERLADFKAAKEKATELLNEKLRWSVDIRTGFVTGRTWFEAK